MYIIRGDIIHIFEIRADDMYTTIRNTTLAMVACFRISHMPVPTLLLLSLWEPEETPPEPQSFMIIGGMALLTGQSYRYPHR